MSANELTSCIVERKKPLAAFLALAILLCTIYVNIVQSHTSEVYIKYLGENAQDGYAADGSELNPYEITNSLVIKRTLDELGMPNANQAEFQKNITISPVIATAEEEKYAAWIDNFSDYSKDETNKPAVVYYSVKFRTTRGADFANQFLGALIKQYKMYYVSTHAGNSDLIQLSDKVTVGQDYFTTADVLKNKIKTNITYLQSIASNDKDYRSPETGYSMQDLASEYSLLLENDLASVTQDILERGLSKDPIVLKTTLRDNADNALLDSNRNAGVATSHKDMMLVYSRKNSEYTWGTANRASNDGGDQVREDTERDTNYNREEMTYDNLMFEYVNYATTSEDLLIDKKYDEKYITYFGDNATTDAKIDGDLTKICDRYNKLHNLTEDTLSDYNHYKASRYIAEVSGISTDKTLGEMIYYAVAVVLALGFGVIYIMFCELFKRKKL